MGGKATKATSCLNISEPSLTLWKEKTSSTNKYRFGVPDKLLM
jgi:hypothetical protein